MNPKTFTTTFEIDQAIRWELYKSNLAEELIDRSAANAVCPQEIKQSAYTGEVSVDGKVFSVTLIEGEQP